MAYITTAEGVFEKKVQVREGNTSYNWGFFASRKGGKETRRARRLMCVCSSPCQATLIMSIFDIVSIWRWKFLGSHHTLFTREKASHLSTLQEHGTSKLLRNIFRDFVGRRYLSLYHVILRAGARKLCFSLILTPLSPNFTILAPESPKTFVNEQKIPVRTWYLLKVYQPGPCKGRLG